MVNVVNISDFRNNISDYINRVIYRNDSFFLKKGKTIVAKVVFYNEKKESLSNEKIKKYAGILNDKEAETITKHMKKFRNTFQMIANK